MGHVVVEIQTVNSMSIASAVIVCWIIDHRYEVETAQIWCSVHTHFRLAKMRSVAALDWPFVLSFCPKLLTILCEFTSHHPR